MRSSSALRYYDPVVQIGFTKKCSVAFIKNVYIEKTHKVILYFRNEQDMKKVKESGFIQTKAYFKLD
ncbi:hypothetical protein RIR_jg13104.t1 [Rhizophagus irregularis DAOM 181602=DAOM 197198]|nr:hypothetical protein RIR_jg13104.t1 [Rhizophagus irregularis DAOM 181602=DAOM 197198]